LTIRFTKISWTLSCCLRPTH